jgi:hypothetical protein
MVWRRARREGGPWLEVPRLLLLNEFRGRLPLFRRQGLAAWHTVGVEGVAEWHVSMVGEANEGQKRGGLH